MIHKESLEQLNDGYIGDELCSDKGVTRNEQGK
jgi:hypothetical protein